MGQGYAVRFFCDVVCGEFLFWFMGYCLIMLFQKLRRATFQQDLSLKSWDCFLTGVYG